MKVDPFFFGHDLYFPKSPDEGGPYTIGRVIKSGRTQGNTAFYGGVAVFDQALTAGEMKVLAEINQGGTLQLKDLVHQK